MRCRLLPLSSLRRRTLVSAATSAALIVLLLILLLLVAEISGADELPPPIGLIAMGLLVGGSGCVAFLLSGATPRDFAACAVAAVVGASMGSAFVFLAAEGESYQQEFYGEVHIIVATAVLAIVWGVSCLAILLAIFVGRGIQSAP